MADAPKDATPQGKKTATGGKQRPVDITLFGATGFVGKILAGWLAEHAPKDVTVALAGRNREKLVFLKQQLLTIHQGVMDWQIVEADAFDEDAMTKLAKNTRVVISTVGPFVRYGEDLVRACAEAGTHYVDSTGEVLFMRKMIDKYDDVAKAHGARIIHACGFDSVPSDLGMLLINEAAAKDGKKLAEVTNLVSMRGAMSGGTVESAREQFQAAQRDPEQGRVLADPYSLSPDREAEPELGAQPDYGVLQTETVGAPEGWAGPFLMASVNTRVVRRSNALSGFKYGKSLRYREFQSTGPGLKGRAQAYAMGGVQQTMLTAMKAPKLRDFLSQWAPEPGEGPTSKAQENGYFRCVFHGFVKPNPAPNVEPDYIATLYSQGDPGYRSTSRMLGTAALTLLKDEAELPGAEGGVLTPATGLGMVYVRRLRESGMRLDVARGGLYRTSTPQ